MPRKIQASLFVVSTPIGNLRDITERALEVLGGVDFIASESVRKTRNLLRHYDIDTALLSYREANSRRMIPKILDALRDGRSVALVAEAGTPGISDPGRDLVDAAHREGFRVVPVPGPSAAIAAVSAAGMNESRFVFEGFLPRRKSKRLRRLEELARDERLLVFFEAPHRLAACLEDMRAVLGDRRCLLAREITKMHEEVVRGSLAGLAKEYAGRRPRGEFVIVCEGAGGTEAPRIEDVREEALALIREGMKKSEAAKAVAAAYGLKKRDVYSLIMDETVAESKQLRQHERLKQRKQSTRSKQSGRLSQAREPEKLARPKQSRRRNER